MIPRELIGQAEVPGGSPLRLIRHCSDFIIMLEHNELMSSRMSGSETALGRMTCHRLQCPASANVLIGGYGMGFTLRAVLAETGPTARVIVAELLPEIIDWARGPMAAMTGACLDDSRVEIRLGDVAGMIGAGRGTYDAALLEQPMTGSIRRTASRALEQRLGRRESWRYGRHTPMPPLRSG